MAYGDPPALDAVPADVHAQAAIEESSMDRTHANVLSSDQPEGAASIPVGDPCSSLEQSKNNPNEGNIGLTTLARGIKRTRVEELQAVGDNNSSHPPDVPARRATPLAGPSTNHGHVFHDPSNVPARTATIPAAASLSVPGMSNKRQKTISGHVPTSHPVPQIAQPAPPRVCIQGRYKRADFQPGDIIALPFHRPNMDPRLHHSDRFLTQTAVGPAYSKRRYAVVMWKYDRDMFCLPLFTFNGQGLEKQPLRSRGEYACIMHVYDNNFYNAGRYPPLKVQTYNGPWHKDSVAYLAAGFHASYDEDISRIGSMTNNSLDLLIDIWVALSYSAGMAIRDSSHRWINDH